MEKLKNGSHLSVKLWMVGVLFLSASIMLVLMYDDLHAVPSITPLKSPQAVNDLESRVMEIFEKNCTSAGCHSGSYPQQGLKLTREAFYSTTVNQPSVEKPGLMRVDPGNPDSSYLVMKILGTAGITGLQMPFGKGPLTQQEIQMVVEWVKSISQPDTARIEQSQPVISTLPFPGWKVVNSPTTRTLDAGRWLFLIGHRFVPKVSDGYDAFYGLDGSATMFLNMGYAFWDDFFINLGRSNLEDDVEFDMGYRFLKQMKEKGLPLAAAVQLSVNWISQKISGEDRFRSQAFKYALQVPVSHQIREGYSVIVVPGILLNPNSKTDGEDPMMTIGLGARAHFYKSLSFIADWAPIVSGYTLTTTLGAYNRWDSWAGGIEIDLAGHVFQIVATNSAGLATDQYMRGGDLNIADGDFRLGFNIYRILQF
jgi:hypothetical protein